MRVVNIENKDDMCPERGPHDRGTDFSMKIITLDTEETLIIGISNDQNCCEDWGINTDGGPDDPYELEFSSIEVVYDVEEEFGHGIKFLDENGDRICCWYAYNDHNGYYPHNSFVKDLNDNYFRESL
jgi:hypothetical protein